MNRNCYTYLIGWSRLNTVYYGRRTAKNCDPTDLWVKYFTSSKYVKEFRELHGEPDNIQIRKTFGENTARCAVWEQNVLCRLDAAKDERFLNKVNSDGKFSTTGIKLSLEAIRRQTAHFKGVPKTKEHKQKIGDAQRGIPKPWTVENHINKKLFLDSLTLEEKQIKYGKHMIDMSEDDRLKCSKTASKHNYQFISPTGDIYEHHSIPMFSKIHGLDIGIIYRRVDKGVIEQGRYSSTSENRSRTIGWEIKIAD